MGDMPQRERLEALNKIKSGELEILVATDIAARGLQIDDLELVVNYDIPEDYEAYLYRIGRTARAGKSGKAITLACEEYIYGLEAIENYIQMKIPVVWADEVGLSEVVDKSAGYKPSSRKVNSKGPSNSKKSSNKVAPKKPAKTKSASNMVFDRLVAAGARLVAVIQKCKGMANKDLGKFADQINALCDKWDR